MIITTNLECSRWTEMFPDAMMTAVLIDWLTYNARILNMNGEFDRLKEWMGKKGFIMENSNSETKGERT